MGDNIKIMNTYNSIINVKSTLTRVSQSIDRLSNDNQEIKEELKQLINELSKLLQHAPSNNAEDAATVAKRIDAAFDEVNKAKPDKELVNFNIESLKKAAANIAGVFTIVENIAKHILQLVN